MVCIHKPYTWFVYGLNAIHSNSYWMYCQKHSQPRVGNSKVRISVEPDIRVQYSLKTNICLEQIFQTVGNIRRTRILGVRPLYLCQIWSRYLHSFKSCKGGPQNFEIRSRDLGHAHLGVVFWSGRSRGQSSMSVPNLKQISLFVPMSVPNLKQISLFVPKL